MHHLTAEQIPAPLADEETARAVFSRAHERPERHFQSVVARASSEDPIALREAWRVFQEELLGHLADEEVQILPAFARQRPVEARALVDEHARIRARLVKLGIDLDLHCLPAERIADFIATLRAHARHEDDLLYPWAARRLGQAASGRIQKELAEAEETQPPCNRDLELGASGDGEPIEIDARVEATRSKRAP
jgi:iron-sulfur cluster repair protein YtfE (RIC family)